MADTLEPAPAAPEDDTAVLDEAEAPEESEQPETLAEERESVIELSVQLGHDLSVLAFCEAQLTASRHMPEVRRAARDISATVVAAIAFLTAFAFVNVAAMLGLSTAVSSWLAALILAVVWIALGSLLVVALSVRAGRVTGWHWWRVFSGGPEESLEDLARARADAEVAVRETLEKLAPAITVEIASAAMPLAGDMAGDMAESAVDVGGDLLEASDDMVEAIVEDIPGGGVVNQLWDVVLLPGRQGVRIATMVLKRGEPESGP